MRAARRTAERSWSENMKKVPPNGRVLEPSWITVGDAAHGELAHAEVQLATELVAVRPLPSSALGRGEGGSAL